MSVIAITGQNEKGCRTLINSIDLFTEDEKGVALELLDLAIKGSNKDYLFFVTVEDGGEFSSFICFGPTPMTHGTYDLYWIGTSPKHTKKGLAKKLVEFMKEYLREHKGRVIRVETSSKESYGGTQAFYDKIGFLEEARIRDFYDLHDDLIIYTARV